MAKLPLDQARYRSVQEAGPGKLCGCHCLKRYKLHVPHIIDVFTVLVVDPYHRIKEKHVLPDFMVQKSQDN